MISGATHHARPRDAELVVLKVELTAGVPALGTPVGEADAVVDADAVADDDAEADAVVEDETEAVALEEALDPTEEDGCDPDEGCELADGRGVGVLTGRAPQVPP